MSNDPRASWESVPLGVKVAFLSDPRGYGGSVREVALRETRMSWVFLAGERVYKLKKPLRTDVLDFSTLARREAACRTELRLNQRLAARTYLDVTPLCWTEGGLAIGGGGRIGDWLVRHASAGRAAGQAPDSARLRPPREGARPFPCPCPACPRRALACHSGMAANRGP